MKKYLLMIALAVAALFTGCSENDGKDEPDNKEEETIKVSLNVTGIADNQATISISLSEGNFYGAKLVEAVKSNTVSIDYTNEIKLINYVKENGVDIDLPYSNTITDLRADDSMFTAVIVFNSEGSAVDSAYQIWTVVGETEYWSEDNNAGSLEERTW